MRSKTPHLGAQATLIRRRTFLTAAALASLAVAACATGGSLTPKNYPHMVLSRPTLLRYPDSVDSVDSILRSEGFAGRDVVVELVAGWCQPCQRQEPQMDSAMAALVEQGAQLARLTVYFDGRTTRDVAYRSTVKKLTRSQSFPEVQLWRDAQALPAYLKGAHSRAEIETFIKDGLGVPAQAPA